jgi:hypothetical protein
MRYFLVTMLFAVIAQATPDAPGSFNDWMHRGNVAAQKGEFNRAIACWKKTLALDRGPDVKCRGEFQRVAIKAAQETLSMLKQGKLRQPEAPKWFSNHETELWMPNPCNSN